jgi:hypothetical protein
MNADFHDFINTKAIDNISLGGAERRSSPYENEIAASFELAMTLRIPGAFVLAKIFLLRESARICVLTFGRNTGEMPEVAEGARLEIVCPAKSGTVGSNPTLSARKNDNGTQINADFQDIKNSKSHQIEKEARKIL